MLLALLGNSQGSWQGQLYHSIEPFDRITAKVLTTFHHDFTGTSHLGLILENFNLGIHTANSIAVEFGYIFDNIGKKKHWEFGPIANMGMMYYDGNSNWRLQMGIDIAYRFNPYFTLNLSTVGGKENSHQTPQYDLRENVYVVSLGASFRPHFYRKH